MRVNGALRSRSHGGFKGPSGRRGHNGARSLLDEDGSAAAAVLGWIAVTSLVLAALLGLGIAHGAHAEARTAADLAALAGADALAVGTAPCPIAESVARRNGARLSACRIEGERVWLEVTVTRAVPLVGTGHVRAAARAGPAPSGG